MIQIVLVGGYVMNDLGFQPVVVREREIAQNSNPT